LPLSAATYIAHSTKVVILVLKAQAMVQMLARYVHVCS